MRYTFKLIIAGDGGVGKTTLVDRYVSGQFHDNSRITLGVQFMVKRLTVNGNPVDLQIWDFGGEDRFRFILSAYCKGAHGAVFMYDITNPSSLYHIDDWMLVLRSQNGKFPVLAAGTKSDLNYARKVEQSEAVKITGKYGIHEVLEVSSKTGQNVDQLFEGICLAMMGASHMQSPTPLVKSKVTAPQIAIAAPVPNAVAAPMPNIVVNVQQNAKTVETQDVKTEISLNSNTTALEMHNPPSLRPGT